MASNLDVPVDIETKDVTDSSARLTWSWRYVGVIVADDAIVYAGDAQVIAGED